MCCRNRRSTRSSASSALRCCPGRARATSTRSTSCAGTPLPCASLTVRCVSCVVVICVLGVSRQTYILSRVQGATSRMCVAPPLFPTPPGVPGASRRRRDATCRATASPSSKPASVRTYQADHLPCLCLCRMDCCSTLSFFFLSYVTTCTAVNAPCLSLLRVFGQRSSCHVPCIRRGSLPGLGTDGGHLGTDGGHLGTGCNI